MMLEQTRFDRLFATPMMRFRLPDHAVFDAALLLEGEALRAQGGGAQKSNRGGWHSPGNLFDHDAPCIRDLHSAALQAVSEVSLKVNPKLDMDGFRVDLFGWMNMNPPGGFNAPHTHPGAHWSGVYYVSQPEVAEGNSGMIEFLDPRADLPHWRIFKTDAFGPKRRIRPQAGEMIIFPSYLVHWVYPNETAQERVSIAFNARLKKAS